MTENLFTKTQTTFCRLNRDGFTLIEMLIVLLIIGILGASVIGMVNINSVRARARDSQRIKDLRQIQTALELYYENHHEYPRSTMPLTATAQWLVINGEDDLLTLQLEPNYIGTVPVDVDYDPSHPIPGQGPCRDPDEARYSYRTDDDNLHYLLAAIMEDPDSNEGHRCDTDSENWDNEVDGCPASMNTEDFCYFLEDPH